MDKKIADEINIIQSRVSILTWFLENPYLIKGLIKISQVIHDRLKLFSSLKVLMTTVLYIEDNDRNVFMLKHRPKSRGFEVLVATDGEHGVQTAQLEHPDIILMDLLAGKEWLAGYLSITCRSNYA